MLPITQVQTPPSITVRTWGKNCHFVKFSLHPTLNSAVVSYKPPIYLCFLPVFYEAAPSNPPFLRVIYSRDLSTNSFYGVSAELENTPLAFCTSVCSSFLAISGAFKKRGGITFQRLIFPFMGIYIFCIFCGTELAHSKNVPFPVERFSDFKGRKGGEEDKLAAHILLSYAIKRWSFSALILTHETWPGQ